MPRHYTNSNLYPDKIANGVPARAHPAPRPPAPPPTAKVIIESVAGPESRVDPETKSTEAKGAWSVDTEDERIHCIPHGPSRERKLEIFFANSQIC
ncbi:hypothetical protein EVAR_39444_1 [Eumeta japonica]|uniref:Uncharacterized protein n=1 Tax=Eumeta variegata TaxID=151549 RepID=A0A4C1VYT7_EUMVA|nr:hypothetical protein EVAR_39444_1 [Eumeta japonica]